MEKSITTKNEVILQTAISKVVNITKKKEFVEIVDSIPWNLHNSFFEQLFRNYGPEVIDLIPSKLFHEDLALEIAIVYGPKYIEGLPYKCGYVKNKFAETTTVTRFPTNIRRNRKGFEIDIDYYADGEYALTDWRSFTDLSEASKYLNSTLKGLRLYQINFKNDEIKNVDLSGVYVFRQDIERCPGAIPVSLEVESKKYNSTKKEFCVTEAYYANGEYICRADTRYFPTLDAFAGYLFNDLSGTDFGTYNIDGDLSKYNLTNTKYDTNDALINYLRSNSQQLVKGRKGRIDKQKQRRTGNKAHYISDIHFEHLIPTSCTTDYLLNTIITNKARELNTHQLHPLFVLGDVSSSLRVNKRLLTARKYVPTIYILGNHELWEGSYKSIIRKYEKEFEGTNVIVLQNSLYCFHRGKETIYNRQQLSKLSIKKIREITANKNMIVLGGIGFAGRNKRFNALQGIYRGTISREDEIKESKAFEKLYAKLLKAIPDRSVIIATHMPPKDWSDIPLNPNWIYLHGHTHMQRLINNKSECIIADNQIGYSGKKLTLKTFTYNGIDDRLSKLPDGIYEITPEEYREFCFNKGIHMQYSSFLPIIMLKKCGYFMFMRKHTNNYVLLDGGRPIKVKGTPRFYYDNMDRQKEILQGPYKNYFEYQKRIAAFIKKFGGEGSIHGAIIDIDFYNHIYVNPHDGKLTPYYAQDIVNKTLYSNLETLLIEQRPDLHKKYLKQNEGQIIPYSESSANKIEYKKTDIYPVSRELKAMQYLYRCKIIRRWYDIPNSAEIIKDGMDLLLDTME